MREGSHRIAVVCVHGVADQAPLQTSGAVASLLQSLPPDPSGVRLYGAFTDSMVTVRPERPIAGPGSDRHPRLGWPALRSPFVRSLDVADSDDPFRNTPDDIRFTAELCREHRIDASQDAFTSHVLSGKRADESGSALQIDLFEMYWADLSRLGTGPARVFGGFYQLLLHLMGVGRDTLGLAAAARSRSRLIRIAARLHEFATWVFTLPVVLLNVLLLLLAGAGALTTAPLRRADVAHSLAAILVGIVALTLALFLLAKRRHLRPGYAWLPIMLLLVATVLSQTWLKYDAPFFPLSLLVGALIAAGVAYYRAILAPYSLVRPGALSVGLLTILLPTAAIPLSWHLWPEPTLAGPPQYVAAMAETVYLVLDHVIWLFYLLPALFVAALSAIVFLARRRGSSSVTAADARALATGLVALMVPPSLFLVTLLAIWSMLGALLERLLDMVSYIPLFPGRWAPYRPVCWPLTKFLESIVIRSAGPGFDLFIVAVTATAATLVLGLIPSVLSERRAPSYPDASRRLGDWLDGGLGLATPAFVVLAIGAYVVLPVPWLVDHLAPGWHPPPRLEQALDLLVPSEQFLPVVGSILALLGASWLALGRGITTLSRMLRPVVDVVLDVDNWLRNHPADRTVRARIVARLAALLHHVAAWRDEDGRGYARVVVVAHSQGAVIVAETLRLAALAPSAALGPHLHAWRAAGMPTRLLTVGSPLRQLYGWRFPYLYRWAWHDGRETCGPSWPIPDERRPDPRELDVELWVNAYSSGDYVGRYLWRPDHGDGRWLPWLPARDGQPSFQDPALSHDGSSGPPTRLELCLGAGAHTRYLDPDQTRIARLIDWLIVQSAPVSAGPSQ